MPKCVCYEWPHFRPASLAARSGSLGIEVQEQSIWWPAGHQMLKMWVWGAACISWTLSAIWQAVWTSVLCIYVLITWFLCMNGQLLQKHWMTELQSWLQWAACAPPVTTSSTLILTPPPIHVWPYQFFLQLTLSLPVWVDNWMTLYRHGAINRKETTWCHYLGRGPEARIYNSIGWRSSWVTQHIVFTQALHKCW